MTRTLHEANEPVQRRRARGMATVLVLAHLGSLTALLPLVTPKPPVPTLPIRVMVAAENSQPVRDTAWIDAQIARAEDLYGPFRVHFRKAATAALDSRFAHVVTRADRDALGAHTAKGVINVFIVGSIRDVDKPDHDIQGVHWRQTKADRNYILVASVAGATTLAHELGHFFGLPHDFTTDNLMSYSRTGGTVFLTDAQKQKILTQAKWYVAHKRLLP